MTDQSDQQDRVRRAMEEAEKQGADALEQLVHSNAFGELLARSTENVMGLTRIGFDTFDLIVRNLRIAGRRDVVRLGRQLARTEDKLERVLQEVEQLRDEVAASGAGNGNGSRSSSSSRSRSSSSGSRGGSSGSSSGGSRSSSNGSGSRRKSSSSRSR